MGEFPRERLGTLLGPGMADLGGVVRGLDAGSCWEEECGARPRYQSQSEEEGFSCRE